MKVIVVSDTHGRIDPFLDKIKDIENIDYLIHLGDMVNDANRIKKATGLPMYVVRGNNDFLSENTPWKKLITFEQHKILLTHGHHERVNWGIDTLYYTAKEAGAEMVLFGHTHVYLDEIIEGVRILNPGSAGYDRGGEYESFAILEISNEEIKVERIRI